MAKQPNLDRAKREAEAYANKIRNMIDALNSDLVDLKARDNNVKLIPEEKKAPVRKMFGDATRAMKENMQIIRQENLQNSLSNRVKQKVEALEKERMRFMGMGSMQRGAKEPMRGRDISGQAYK